MLIKLSLRIRLAYVALV